MKVLVTGGCGFVGTNLVRYLTEHDYVVRILDNFSTAFPAWRQDRPDHGLQLPDVDLVVGDIVDRHTVDSAVSGMDAVVHLAALTSVTESVEHPETTWRINVDGTFNLLESCRNYNVNTFVFASSNAVAGEQTPPIHENKIPQPLSPYGASKLAGEALCSAYYHSFGIGSFSLRFANLYGPYADHKSSVMPLFFKWIKSGQPLVVYGDGQQTRDFVHVDDVCLAVHLALGSSGPFGEVFQIARGQETSVNELVQVLKIVTGADFETVYQPERVGEIRRNYSDITKARNLLGFEPEVDLQSGLEVLWDHENR